MESLGDLRPAEDDLRPEYDLRQLRRVAPEKPRRRERPTSEPLELTSAFPAFDDGPPPGFQRDEKKLALNIRKHGVTFNEASTVFDNPLAVTVYDPDHSEEEDRYLIIGDSARGRLIIVSLTAREEGARTIS